MSAEKFEFFIGRVHQGWDSISNQNLTDNFAGVEIRGFPGPPNLLPGSQNSPIYDPGGPLDFLA